MSLEAEVLLQTLGNNIIDYEHCLTLITTEKGQTGKIHKVWRLVVLKLQIHITLLLQGKEKKSRKRKKTPKTSQRQVTASHVLQDLLSEHLRTIAISEVFCWPPGLQEQKGGKMRSHKPQFILYLQLLDISEKGRKTFRWQSDSEAVDVFANSKVSTFPVERKYSAMSQNQKEYGTLCRIH